MDMTFADFSKVYKAEVRPRVREHTWLTKETIIQSKLLPFFGDMRICAYGPSTSSGGRTPSQGPRGQTATASSPLT